jgi:hypothetical protein
MDYGIYERCQLRDDADWDRLPEWDIFLSAYNSSERVRIVYDRVRAKRKLWLVHPEYGLSGSELPAEEAIAHGVSDESTFSHWLVGELKESFEFDVNGTSICLDITGMLRPHLMFLVQHLEMLGLKRLHIIYAEPVAYKRKENTSFSVGAISEVRAVQGYEGSPNTDTSNDLVIIGVGYDDKMLAEVAEDKDKADKFQLFGLPSLRADMYQQSVIRSRSAADVLGDPLFLPSNRGFAPANDPFATAEVLGDIVARRSVVKPITNLYIAPLGTKAQALGFALYFIAERRAGNTTMIFPFSERYAPETTRGLAGAWCYTVEFPIV